MSTLIPTVTIPLPAGIDANPASAFTSGALKSVIETAWNSGSVVGNVYMDKMAAINGTGGYLDTVGTPTVTAGTVGAPTLNEPAVNIPSTVDTTGIYGEYKTQYLELVALLSDKYSAFQASYFPNDSADYTAVQSWLEAAVANPNAGLPLAVQQQMLEDDRGRILAEATRATEEVLGSFAARRYPLPPGAAASAVLQIQQKAQDGIAESSRKIAIMAVEQMKFAVEKLINCRQMAMTSAMDYIKALASGPDMAGRLVNIGYDAQSKLISSASQFYNSRISAQELAAKVSQFNVSTGLEAAAKNQAAELSLVEQRIKSLLSEAQVLATITASLFNNVHASAGTGYSASVAA